MKTLSATSFDPNSCLVYFDEDFPLKVPDTDTEYQTGRYVAGRPTNADETFVGQIVDISVENKKMMVVFCTVDGTHYYTIMVPSTRCVVLNDFQYQMALTYGRLRGEVGNQQIEELLRERARVLTKLNKDESLPSSARCPKCDNQLFIAIIREVKSTAMITGKRKGKYTIENFVDQDDTAQGCNICCPVCGYRESVDPDDVLWSI